MFFIVQKEKKGNFNNVEYSMIMELLHTYRYSHEYITMQLSDFYQEEDDLFESTRRLKDASEFDERVATGIPIGEIAFIEKWLKIFHGIEYENAIEVPPILRSEKYLKRNYSIVKRDEIPRSGYYFVKDATRQKRFAVCGMVENYINDEMFEPAENKYDMSVRLEADHLYQVSEVVYILAEYRVYVLQGDINQVTCYKGDPLIFPDSELIKEAVDIYKKQPDSPRSFSLDVLVTNRGTCIAEVHNFTSVGLYTVDWDDSLLYAYRDGIEYVIKHNIPQTECRVECRL